MPGRKVLDLELVRKLAGYGLTDEEIADCCQVARSTLHVKARDILRQARAAFIMSLRKRQLRAAWKGNTAMLIWLGKQYLGQRDQPAEGPQEIPPPRIIRTIVRADGTETADG